MKTPVLVLVWISRILVGVLFIVSGLIKANDTMGFAYKMEEYFHVFGTEFMVPFAQFLSTFFCILEIALGVAVLAGYMMNLSSWLLIALIVFFTFLTGYSAITNTVTDCGCFGDAVKLTPWQSFCKDLVLLFFIVILFVFRNKIKPLGSSIIGGITTGIATLSSCIFCWYTYNHLPVKDFRPYKIGTNVKTCINTFDPEKGSVKCKDYFPFKATCNEDEFQGNTLMVIMYDMEKADESGIRASVALAAQLMPEGVKVMGGTSTGSDTREQLVKKYSINYCLSPQDATMLKTMVRSNPGFILLKEGKVVNMWHYNDIPTAEVILQSLK